MCGINGIIYFKELVNAEALIHRITLMNKLLTHRGPDSDGLYTNAKIALGFRRLSIIDLSSEANQPMYSSDKSLVIVFNGEIYNYREIKKELEAKGYVFNTQSDTEVILNSYTEWGYDCVSRFNGMWAFVIYDLKKDIVFASRDRLGVKPFYYSHENEYLIFSSETKAIVEVENKRKANKNKAFEYLAYGYIKTRDGETFYQSIKELLPGHSMIIESGAVKFVKYWELKGNVNDKLSKQDAYEQFEKLLTNAVELRYRSDVPIAILLSGGLDSSALAAVTEDLIQKGLITQNDIEAFTVHFPGYEKDELEIVKEFAKTLKHVKLNILTPQIKDIADDINNIVYQMDQPLGAFTHLIHNQMMKMIHNKGIKVALNGQGADEAFYGYDRNIFGYYLVDCLLHSRRDFIKQVRFFHKNLGYSYKLIISQMYKACVTRERASFVRAKYQEQNIDCLTEKFVVECKSHFKFNYRFSLKGNNLRNYSLEYINNTGLNSILHYEDVSSMQSSIEMRSPFVDYRIFEFAFTLPDNFKLRDGVTKKIIRETVGKKLPLNIRSNFKKTSFSSPFTEYMKVGEMADLIKSTLASKDFKSRGIWRHEQIVERFSNPDKYPNFPFWRFLNYELWAKVNRVTGL